MSETSPSRDPELLAIQYLDGWIEIDDLRLLNSGLLADPAFARRFVDACIRTRELREILAPRSIRARKTGAVSHETPEAETAVAIERDAIAQAAEQSPKHRSAARPKGLRKPFGGGSLTWPIAAALCVLISLAVWAMRQKTTPIGSAVVSTTSPSGIIGHITKAVDCQWKEKHMFTAVGTPLGVGQLDLLSGTVELTMGKDVRVVLTGPVRADLRSPSDVFLHQGKISAEVGVGGVGFTVNTKSAHVVDLGTAFGVIVTPDGLTETHVFRGKVTLQPTVGGAIKNLVAGDAFAVTDGGAVVQAEYRPALFGQQPKTLDLVDIVAGGDGTQGRRGRGINPGDGSVAADGPTAQAASGSDGQFHTVRGVGGVAGIFIPTAGKQVTLDPAGHVTDSPGNKDNGGWGWLWAGGKIPADRVALREIPSVVDGVDYASAGHGMLFMHANLGVTFDLSQLRKNGTLRDGSSRFRAVAGNIAKADAPGSTRFSDIRIFVDGQLVLNHRITRGETAFDVDLTLNKDSRFLTLLGTDGGDGILHDWLFFGDPILEME